VNYNFHIITYILLIAAIAATIMAIALWPRRKARGAFWLFLLEIAIGIWSLAAAFEVAATTVSLKYLWTKFSYIGNATTAPLFFLFTYEYARQRKFSNPRKIFLLFLLPLIYLIIAATNDYHHLHWSNLIINPVTNLGVYVHGPLFWIFVAFNYLLLMIGVIYLLRALFQFNIIYRPQNIVILTASLFPIVGNVLYVFRLLPYPGMDWTPPAFAITGILLGWSLLRFKMFKLIPVARNQIIDTMPDGLVVLDAENQIIDANPSIQKILQQRLKSLIGNKIGTFFPDSQELQQALERTEETFIELKFNSGSGENFYEVRIIPLVKEVTGNSGKSVLFHDFTKRKLIEIERESLVRKLQDALAEVKTLNGLLPICSHCKKIRDDQGYWQNVEEYVRQRTHAEFSHGICPDCMVKLYPDIAERIKLKKK